MMKLDEAGLIVPQHSHTEPHTTLLTSGALRAWRGGELLGDFHAPSAIYIEAFIKHKFVSLEKNTLAFCVFSKPPVTHETHDLQEAITCLSAS
jgi:quercetin dioxygenase-like cupin family protein